MIYVLSPSAVLPPVTRIMFIFNSPTQDVIRALPNAVASANAPRASAAFFAVGERLETTKIQLGFFLKPNLSNMQNIETTDHMSCVEC